jgi:hypothetical protein
MFLLLCDNRDKRSRRGSHCRKWGVTIYLGLGSDLPSSPVSRAALSTVDIFTGPVWTFMKIPSMSGKVHIVLSQEHGTFEMSARCQSIECLGYTLRHKTGGENHFRSLVAKGGHFLCSAVPLIEHSVATHLASEF